MVGRAIASHVYVILQLCKTSLWVALRLNLCLLIIHVVGVALALGAKGTSLYKS